MTLLREGDTAGPYVVCGMLGGGAMGEVYRVAKLGPSGFRREYALKVIASDHQDDVEFAALFEAEARLAAQLHHQNLNPVLDHGIHDGMPWLSQELVHGWDLKKLCRRTPLPLCLALYVTGEILRGLKYAHEHPLRVVHRDIKPSNILVGRDGSVRITDFGVAKATAEHGDETTGLRGSPAYMAPECYLDFLPSSPRSDLFAVGLVLWEMLTGRPLLGTTALRARVLKGELPRLAVLGVVVPGHVEAFIAWLLARDPDARCPSAEVAICALRDFPEARAASARDLELFLGTLGRSPDPGPSTPACRGTFDAPVHPTRLRQVMACHAVTR